MELFVATLEFSISVGSKNKYTKKVFLKLDVTSWTKRVILYPPFGFPKLFLTNKYKNTPLIE